MSNSTTEHFNKDLYRPKTVGPFSLCATVGGRDGLPEGRGHPVAERIEFGPFRLDTGKRVLWRGRELVSVPPKALDLLVALVEQRGDVVSKQDLLSRVWPDTFVEEANLSVNASILRKVLGTQEDGRAYLENVPRRGYRFVAETRAQAEVGPALAGRAAVPRPGRHRRRRLPRPRHGRRADRAARAAAAT